jgi:hypothetical protein
MGEAEQAQLDSDSDQSSTLLEGDSAPGQPDEPTTQANMVQPYSLSPRRVGMVAVAFAAASLTALAVVASVEGAEALSTIALVLAIVAFTIQIFLFVVQNQTASEQRVRSEQINTQTRALLAEVRATAQATQAMVSQQFNQLLQAFVTGAAQTAQETKFDPERFEQLLMSNIRTAAQPPAPATPQTRPVVARERPQSASEQPINVPTRVRREQAGIRLRQRNERPSLLKSFPASDEGRTAVGLLRDMEPGQRRRLRELAEDEIDSARRGAYVGLPRSDEDNGLQDRDFVTSARVEVNNGERKVVTRLTDAGVAAARILTALGDVPDWARDVVESDAAERPPWEGDDDIPF